MSRKPCGRKLRAADSSVASNAARARVIVPAKRMWPVGGSIAAFGHVGEHRRDQRVAERARDALGQHARAHVVLAERHVRAVLLGAADRHDDRRLAGLDRIAHLGPRELLDQQARRRLRGGDVGRGGGKEHGGDAAAKQ